MTGSAVSLIDRPPYVLSKASAFKESVASECTHDIPKKRIREHDMLMHKGLPVSQQRATAAHQSKDTYQPFVLVRRGFVHASTSPASLIVVGPAALSTHALRIRRLEWEQKPEQTSKLMCPNQASASIAGRSYRMLVMDSTATAGFTSKTLG